MIHLFGIKYESEQYNIPKSTLYKWRNYSYHKGELRKPGGGRKPALSQHDEQELVSWVHQQNQHKIAVSQQSLQAKARLMKEFKSSNPWLQGFKKRHNLSLQTPALGASSIQYSASELLHMITELWKKTYNLRKQFQLDLSLIGNMDEGPVWFESSPKKTLTQKGQKTVVVQTSCKHLMFANFRALTSC